MNYNDDDEDIDSVEDLRALAMELRQSPNVDSETDFWGEAMVAFGAGLGTSMFAGSAGELVLEVSDGVLERFVHFVGVVWQMDLGDGLYELGRLAGRQEITDAMAQAKSATIN